MAPLPAEPQRVGFVDSRELATNDTSRAVLAFKSTVRAGRSSIVRMGSVDPPSTPATPGDLGFGNARIAVAMLAAGAIPGALTYAMGGTSELVLTAAGSGFVVVAGLGWLVFRSLATNLTTPLRAIAKTMEALRSGEKTTIIHEHAVPLLRPLLHRFNQAFTDISQREQMSRASLTSAEIAFDRVHAVLQSLRECVVVIDVESRVALANRSARQLLQQSATPIEGRPLLALVTGELQEAVQSGLGRIAATSAEEVRMTNIGHGGRIYDLTIAEVQATRPDHNFGKVVVLVDVTRNHEITKLKDELLSSISHELRTPLTNMCSSSEILVQMDPAKECEWREFAQILNLESHRLKTMIDDVLHYNQIESDQLPWQMDVVDLSRLARTAIEMMRGPIDEHQLQVECETDGEDMVLADAQRILEVFCRVLDNACKFTPPGGKALVSVKAHDDLVEVAIADSGAGIRLEDRDRVFERFSQLGDVLVEKPKGAGLGLTICQRIVDSHGGTMWCEDSPLGGAQFRFVLQRVNAPATH